MTDLTVKAPVTVTLSALLSFAATAAAQACGGPGGHYEVMQPVSGIKATHAVEKGLTRDLALPKPSDGSKQLKILTVPALKDSFRIFHVYGTEGGRCPGTPTADVSLVLEQKDLEAAFNQGADVVILDFGGGSKANCPALPAGKPDFSAGSLGLGNMEIRNDGHKDGVSYLRLEDANAIKAAGCVAMHLKR